VAARDDDLDDDPGRRRPRRCSGRSLAAARDDLDGGSLPLPLLAVDFWQAAVAGISAAKGERERADAKKGNREYVGPTYD
jgi:hypothetical protein